MSNREVARLACRVLSLYTVLLVVSRLDWVIAMASTLTHNPDESQPSHMLFAMVLSMCIPFVLLLAFAGILWFKADALAGRMTTRDGGSKTPALNVGTIQTIAFGVVGLVFLLDGLIGLVPYLVAWATTYMVPHPWHWGPVVSLVLGLALMLGARPFSTFITWLRTAGVN